MNQTFLTKQKTLSLLMLFVATFFVTISSSAFNNSYDHEGCTDPCAANYDADATEDDGSCETYDATCDPCVTVWSAQSCGCVPYSIVSFAGYDYTTCSDVISLNANAPVYGAGTWSGPGTFADANDPNTTATLSSTTDGDYTFTWTVDDGCGSIESDNVTITYQADLAVASGGEDEVICGLTTNLNAVKPIQCSGTWILPEGVTSPNPGFPSTTVTAGAAGTYTFIWVVECDGCSNNDEVVITFSGGCNDATACNYDADALCNDGSCIYPTACDSDPCTDGGTYAWDATTCSCELETATVTGCTDQTANNYDANANCNDGCVYDVLGCLNDPCAPNYNADADVDDGSCEDYDTTCNDDCTAGDLSEWDAASCSCVTTVVTVAGCTDQAAINYDANANCNEGCEYDNSVLGCTDPCAPNYDANADTDDDSCEAYDTTCNDDCTAGDLSEWDAASCSCVTTVVTVAGCTDPAANNYDANANCNEGCTYDNPGCTDPCAPNYDETADTDDDSCETYDTTCNDDCAAGDLSEWDAASCSCVTTVVTVAGCTDPAANKYDANANCNEGCTYDNPGCTDPCAPNYDANADTDDDSCETYDTTCNTDCTTGDLEEWDAASCGCVVTVVTVTGCTDPAASNYDANANCDGACTYDNAMIGDYVWFDTNGDGVQDGNENPIGGVVVTLTDPNGSTTTQTTNNAGYYNFAGLAPGTYTVTVGAGPAGSVLTTTGTYTVTVAEGDDYNDADFGFNAEGVLGCTDPCAPNYNPAAIGDDDSCETYNMVCNDDCTEGNLSVWDASMCSCVVTSVTVNGCTDETATNYNPAANCDSGCEYVTATGCTDPCAPNYDANAAINDGSCETYDTTCNTDCTMGDLTAWDANVCGCVAYSITVYGCTNPAALNYDSGANCNDGTCEFSNCIVGCSDPAACNYDEAACQENADIYCVYETACNSDCTLGDVYEWNSTTCQCEFVSGPVPGCGDPTACNYDPDACSSFNAQYCVYETACNSDCTLGDISVWNVDICGCQVVEASYIGCTDPTANNYDANANCGDTDTYCNYGCVPGCSDPMACSYNPDACPGNDDIYCLMESNSNCNTDCTLGYVAEWNPDICNCQVIYYTIVGCNDPSANNYNPEANCGGSEYCTYGCLPGCGDPAACNYVPNACTDNDDTECISAANSNCNTDCSLGYVAEWNPDICNCQVIYYSVNGCTDPSANNYNPEANCDNGEYCDYGLGCTDPCANNFDPNADTNDGSCNDYSTECNSDCINGDITEWDQSVCGCVVISTTIYGCTDPLAINYDLNANCDNGTCELAGCTDPCAPNYNADAAEDNGTCEDYDTTCNSDCANGDLEEWDAATCGCVAVEDVVVGCTDSNANNYNPDANCNDGCEYDMIGCTDPCADNYDPEADLDDGSCNDYDATCNSDCYAGDLEEWDADNCECVVVTVTVVGCTDENATNYDADANCNDGCMYEIPGCTDPCAPNYNIDATGDDDSCEDYDTTCNDDCANGDITEWDADNCECAVVTVTVVGCTDENATNYDANANCNDGCMYEIPGCTDPCAPNYNIDATGDDDSCEDYDTTCNDDCANGDITEWDADNCECAVVTVTVVGCTDPAAANYDDTANCDDGCIYANASIGSYVWFDANGNGAQDSDEDPISGVEVTLTDEDGNIVSTMTTDDDGQYGFPLLVAGTYTVTVGAGPDDTALTTAGSYTVTLGVGDDYVDANFGFNTSVNGGCIDPCAPNYNADATEDDGSCEMYNTTCNVDCNKGNVEVWDPNVCGCVIAYTNIVGCTDKDACNFDPDANCNDGCDYSCYCEIDASVQVVCSPQGDYYQLVFLFSGSSSGSYLVTDNNTGEPFVVTEPFYQSVPFETAGNEGFSYTISSASDLECTKTLSLSVIDCITTAVELIDFTGYPSESGNHLNWITATEMNSDMYIVEKSLNGTDFQAIGTVKAQGNSSVSNSYNFLDVNANERVSYYRLIEMNQLGEKSEASTVVTISRTRNNIDIISISPIPANEFINVSFDAESSTNYQVELFDIAGKLVKTVYGETEAGLNNVEVELSELPIGTYFLAIFDGEEKQVVRFVKD